MSSALARKKRSADIPPSIPNSATQYNPSINSKPTNPSVKTSGLTLPQVITVIDTRLITLEAFMKDSKNNVLNSSSEKQVNTASPSMDFVNSIPNEFLDEIETRFEILAKEISELKEIVLKLQSYTMEVNKTLLEERIHILSDLGENTKEEFVIPSETNDI